MPLSRVELYTVVPFAGTINVAESEADEADSAGVSNVFPLIVGSSEADSCIGVGVITAYVFEENRKIKKKTRAIFEMALDKLEVENNLTTQTLIQQCIITQWAKSYATLFLLALFSVGILLATSSNFFSALFKVACAFVTHSFPFLPN